MKRKTILPELLCPAGDMKSLEAAIEAGADAVYLGGDVFNARAFAKNFSREEMKNAAELCAQYGVKIYAALNTLVFDREINDALKYSEFLYECGISALIITDMGLASLVKKYIPDFELHASTQMSAHGIGAAEILSPLGFTRMVCARELSLKNIKSLVDNAPLEIEMFIHGALCVSHSGQCLMSSIIGGRSGNRGECAQPCRLPYNGKYPLSLKDMCLANHIEEIIESGVSSLKIEGRMKPPEYVYGVSKIYRRLLDEQRNASDDEMKELAEIFCRSGFTNAYFTNKIDGKMNGVRTDDDKTKSKTQTPFGGLKRKISLSLCAEIKSGQPLLLRAVCGGETYTVTGMTAAAAKTAPLTPEIVKRNLTKFGATAYTAENFSLELDENLMLPMSALNSARRALVDKINFCEKILPREIPDVYPPKKDGEFLRTARVYSAENLPTEKEFTEYFDIVFLPLEEYGGQTNGVIIPPVIPDDELSQVKEMLAAAKDSGAKFALVGNVGHIMLAKQAGLRCIGDIRLNTTNGFSRLAYEKLGLENIILSPELTLPRLRDICGCKSAVIYGRLPLMLLEKCAASEISSCKECGKNGVALIDRYNMRFPILRTHIHRNIVFNSLPTFMADKHDEIAMTGCSEHFIFSTESKKQILNIVAAYKAHKNIGGEIRRIKP